MKLNQIELLKKVADTAPALIAVYNIHTGKYIYVNDAIKQILGYSKEQLLRGGSKFIIPLVHKDDLAIIMKENGVAIKRVNSKKKPSSKIETFEYRVKHKNGKWVWLRTDGTVFSRDKKGNVEYVMNISYDNTKRNESLKKERSDREKAQEELQTTKNQLDVILKNIADAVTAQDITGKLIYANMKAAQSSGYSSIDEMMTAPPLDYIKKFELFDEYGEPLDPSLLPGRRAIAGEKNPEVLAKSINKKTKQIQWVHIKSTAILSKNKKPYMVINTMQDITNQKLLEQRKDEFIGIASHELKTPLTSIKGYIQILERIIQELGHEQAKTIVSRTTHYIDRLNSLITDLLDVSRIQSGKLQFSMSKFDAFDIVKDGIDEIQPTTTYKIICKKMMHQQLSGDKNRLDQVFINLLSNAIKYSPESKKVIVSMRKSKHCVVISVTDHGIGIPKESMDKLFRRFYRVESASSKFSGLGIGLYISNEIVTRHGGKIIVESEEGKGSTFSISLPIPKRKLLS